MITSSEDILLILVGFLQLVVAIILLLSYKSNKYVNIFLVLLLLNGAVRSLYGGFMSEVSNTFINHDFSWIRFLLVLTAPNSYLYFKTLINDENRLSPRLLVHLIFPVLWTILVYVQTHYGFVTYDAWHSIRSITVVTYVFFYLVLTLLIIKDFYKNRNLDLKRAKHFNSIKRWVTTLLFFIILVNLRALVHFVFDIEDHGGLFANVSSILKLVFVFLIIFKILISPEILFGYSKLKKAVNSDSEGEVGSMSSVENKILEINSKYYLRDKPIEDYFEGKTLECLLFLLTHNSEFVLVSSLDDLFESEYKASLPTLKKRREQSLKEIRFLLSFRLYVPVDSIFIETRDEVDKRIKMIKFNPELLKLE